jgi:hypothetical protein
MALTYANRLAASIATISRLKADGHDGSLWVKSGNPERATVLNRKTMWFNSVVKFRGRTFLLAPLFAVLVASCSGGIDGILAEHHTVTHGTFKGFVIGDDKEHALLRARSFGIRGKDWTIAVGKGGANVDDGTIMGSDSWEIETSKLPHGEFYDLRFVRDQLVEIRYTRPRIQVN